MARYYFHVHDDIDAVDEEGCELPGQEVARERAIIAARELIADEARKGRINLSHCIVVTDENQRTVITLPFRDVVRIES
jgi:hypothetical protein